jgi:hypothetical protein
VDTNGNAKIVIVSKAVIPVIMIAQRPEPVVVDHGVVHEHIHEAILRDNETKALGGVEPLHLPHLDILSGEQPPPGSEEVVGEERLLRSYGRVSGGTKHKTYKVSPLLRVTFLYL